MPSNYATNTGSLGLPTFVTLPRIPTIFMEWAALIPLISHLANYGEDHQMVGELALSGHLKVALFPKLGYLDGIWRLLQDGADFLDRANTKDEAKYIVWDVNWGSVFTRANGAAISILTKYALRRHPKPMAMPEKILAVPDHGSDGGSTASPSGSLNERISAKAPFRRHQTLHIISLNRKVHTSSIQSKFSQGVASRFGDIFYFILLVSAVVMFCMLGAYGSAAVVLSGLVSKTACRFLRAERPAGYLENNENHEACMLSSVHENSSTWYLYIGDRGVVDWLLNKTMLSTPSAGAILTGYFRLAHLLQLLAMTYVAAQKGVDGVALVSLMLVNIALQWLFGHHRLAKQWLREENVSIKAHTFEFSGRTPMIGAIHMISAARDGSWMDTLLAPCPRLKVWIDELKCTAEMRTKLDRDYERLSPSDRVWVLLNSQLAIEASRIIMRKLIHERAMEDLHGQSSLTT